jgi:hypothetical protein
MAKDVIKEVVEDAPTVELPADPAPVGVNRETKCIFVADGKYKYVYVDTGEDVG